MSVPDKCACGQPLHYTDSNLQRLVIEIINNLGPDIKVTLMDGSRSWMIPRHFIALHGLKGQEIVEVAEKYGFKETTNVAEA